MIRFVRLLRRRYSTSKFPSTPFQPQKRASRVTNSVPKQTKPEKPSNLPPIKCSWNSWYSGWAYNTIDFAIGTLKLTLPLFLVTHVIWTYFVEFTTPEGASMLPTLYLSGDWVLISKLNRRGKGIEVGDIVAFEHPLDAHINDGRMGMTKRVLGMPGDFVTLRAQGDTHGLVDIDDDYSGGWVVQVPQGHCWVEGDDLNWSRDSRVIGAVPLALIRGKVFARILPWRDRCWFKNPLKEVDHESLDGVD